MTDSYLVDKQGTRNFILGAFLVNNTTNEERAEVLLKKYGFNFDTLPHEEIRTLLKNEIENYIEGSSEYLRVLCGYLFCIGSPADVELLNKAKYNISFDVGCMIDSEWIENMDSADNDNMAKRNALISEFVEYYKSYFKL